MVEVVDLPQPDSPTRPTLSPRFTTKLIPSTARNVRGSGAGFRCNTLPNPGPLRGYSFTSLSTMRRGAPALPLLGLSLAAVAAGLSFGRRSRSEAPGRGVARMSLRV